HDSGTSNVSANTAAAKTSLDTLLANNKDYVSGSATRYICYSTSADGSGTCGACPNPPSITSDPSGNPQVQVTVTVAYAHPLFLPLITAILDQIDGSSDNALLVSWASTFRVQNSSTETLSANTCVHNP